MESTFDPRKPQFWGMQSNFDHRQSKFDHMQSNFDPRQSNFDHRQPNFGAVNFLTGMGGFVQVNDIKYT